MTSELKPCPFCGGKARHGINHGGAYNEDYYAISCEGCSVEIQTDGALTEQDTSCWNTRAVPDVPELVTVGYQYLISRTGRCDNMPSDWSAEENKAYQDKNHVTRELVSKDQAVEVFAAIKGELYDMRQERDRAVEWRDHDKQRAEEAEAKNIELEAAWLNAEGKISDLEAELAQIEKQEPVAWSIIFTAHYGVNPDTTFKTRERAEAYIAGCSRGKLVALYAAPVASDADLRAVIIEQCRKAVRNAILRMPPEHRADGDICDDVIAHALAALNPSETRT